VHKQRKLWLIKDVSVEALRLFGSNPNVTSVYCQKKYENRPTVNSAVSNCQMNLGRCSCPNRNKSIDRRITNTDRAALPRNEPLTHGIEHPSSPLGLRHDRQDECESFWSMFSSRRSMVNKPDSIVGGQTHDVFCGWSYRDNLVGAAPRSINGTNEMSGEQVANQTRRARRWVSSSTTAVVGRRLNRGRSSAGGYSRWQCVTSSTPLAASCGGGDIV